MHRFRLLIILLRYLFSRKKRGPLEEFSLSFRVSPFDVEISRQYTHIYFSMMALARWHCTLHLIKWKRAFREKWSPLTYSEHCRYIRALKLFDSVTVRTKFIYWNEKMVYFEHKFERSGELVAIGHSRGALYGHKGFVSPLDSLHGFSDVSLPPEPQLVKFWEDLDREVKPTQS